MRQTAQCPINARRVPKISGYVAVGRVIQYTGDPSVLEPRLSWGASAAGRMYGLGDLDFLRVVRVAMLSGTTLEGSTALIQEVIREVNPSLFDSKMCGLFAA